MIETIFTFYLVFVLNNQTILEKCGYNKYAEQIQIVNEIPTLQNGTAAVEACYLPDSKEIVVGVKTIRPKDLVFYHELAHHLFLRSYDKSLFANEEIMADQFSLFIYGKKYPKMVKLQRKEIRTYFERWCDRQCYRAILSIEIPNLTLPKDFQVRTGFFNTTTGHELLQTISFKLYK